VEEFFKNRKILGIKPGLERINRLLGLLGNPQVNMKAIHVAGTNGKGSTVQYIKNALQANGYQVGVFTSPSFHGLTGHLYLNDEQISEKKFLTLLNEVFPQVEKLDQQGNAPTEFEIITALGFLYFSKTADIALIETGMGGREDTTNCFMPIMSIITNVSMDHTHFLGDTLAKIAYHKAGIIKKHNPVIVGDLKKEALEVIEQEIQLKHSPYTLLGKDFFYQQKEGNKFLWNYEDIEFDVQLMMNGVYQIKNASVALMAVVMLKKMDWHLDMKKAVHGINETTVPGRFEIVHEHPLIILDGAHNPAGIQSFLNTVNKLDIPKDNLIFAAFKDKDVKTMLNILNGHFNNVILTTFDHPRAMKAEELSKYIDSEAVYTTKDWQLSISRIVEDKSSACCITGSLDFISRVRAYLRQME